MRTMVLVYKNLQNWVIWWQKLGFIFQHHGSHRYETCPRICWKKIRLKSINTNHGETCRGRLDSVEKGIFFDGENMAFKPVDMGVHPFWDNATCSVYGPWLGWTYPRVIKGGRWQWKIPHLVRWCSHQHLKNHDLIIQKRQVNILHHDRIQGLVNLDLL